MEKLQVKVFFCMTLLLFTMTVSGQSNQVSTLYYKTNSFKIEKKYLQILNDIGEKCASDTFSFLKIFAYADKKGTKEYNEQLSKKRANEVYNQLTQKFNIDTTKIYVAWLGEETDGAYNLHFPSANVQQRCVDVLVFFK